MRFFDRKAFRVGAWIAILLTALIYVGSRGFRDFDWALSTYAVSSVFAGFAVAYRYAVWAQRPPTKMYLKRGWQLFLQHGPGLLKSEQKRPVQVAKNAASLAQMLLENFFLQKFISKRSYQRWIMHACLSWGGMLAFAITFPLVFGWVHFESLPKDAEVYQVFVLGAKVDQFSIHSLKGFICFNMLNLSAVMVLVGLVLSVKLRMSDRGEMATQTFVDDVMPIFLLFVVSATGLMLTVSYRFMAGYGYGFIGLAHAASVIALLLYLPFGKLFHIFQRTASLGVSFYKKAGARGPQASCKRCGEHFASQMHVDDLKTVLDELGFNFRFAGPDGEIHYQHICPPCRRRLVALNQGRALGR
jgi:hypothetical protein